MSKRAIVEGASGFCKNREVAKIFGAIGISVGNQATVMLVWGLILERIFTL